MKNMIRAIRMRKGQDVSVVSVIYERDDELLCFAPDGRLAEDGRSGGEVARLRARIEALGYVMESCMTCRFFNQSGGMMQDASENLGHCVEGKRGVHLDLGDLTTNIHSCDAYVAGTDDDRAQESAAWASSIAGVPWRKG